MFGDLAQWFREGGPWMFPILLCAVFGAAVVVERFVFIYLRAAINGPLFMAQVQRLVLDGDADGALRLCNAEGAAALPRVLKAGLLHAERPGDEVREAMEEATLEVYPSVTRRIEHLSMLANVSTLLGLLGTIQGLILSFRSVGEAEATERAAALAQGVAVAMNTTYAGLVVAIPLLVAHGLLAARANALLDEIDHYAARLANLLAAARGARGPSGGSPVLPFPS